MTKPNIGQRGERTRRKRVGQIGSTVDNEMLFIAITNLTFAVEDLETAISDTLERITQPQCGSITSPDSQCGLG